VGEERGGIDAHEIAPLIDQRHATRGGVSLVYHGRAAHTIKCVPEPLDN